MTVRFRLLTVKVKSIQVDAAQQQALLSLYRIQKRRCLLAAMLAANSVPVTVEALLLPNKLAAPPAYAFPTVQKAAASKTDC